jgi:hypothetical protein
MRSTRGKQQQQHEVNKEEEVETEQVQMRGFISSALRSTV